MPDRPAHADPLEVIELQAAVLVRNFELLRRRGDSDLGRADYLLLRALECLGPSDINTLAGALGLDPSTAGRQVASMLDDGLVERSPARTDRRRAIIAATARGRRLMTRVSRQRRERTAALLEDWTDSDVRRLAEMFTRYNAAVAERYLTGPQAPAQAALS